MVSLLKKTIARRAAFAGLILLLLAGFSFISCSNPTGSDVTVPAGLVGTWSSGGGDEYSIKGTKLSYNGEDGSFSGTIRYISQFTDTSGVIIIQYDKGHEQVYYTGYETTPPYAPIGDPLPSSNGSFYGIYYDSLEPGVSVEMANAFWLGGAEQGSIKAAKTAYTEDMGVASADGDTYIFSYGTYEWYPE